MCVEGVCVCSMLVLGKVEKSMTKTKLENRGVSTKIEHFFLNTFGHGEKPDEMSCVGDAKLNSNCVF